MRKRSRIDPLLARLAVAWKKAPDLRLGQLIINAGFRDPWFPEDESLIAAIEDFITQHVPDA